MYVYNLVFLCCAILTVALTEGRRIRTRRGVCEHGTYQHEGKTCCLCPTGYRVLSDCTDKSETNCERCENGAFIDHPNSDHQCLPCKICNSNANMDTMVRCSPYSNTVCKCKENYYCEKGDQCKTCSGCDTCEKHGVKQQCTHTSNTVCHDAKEPVQPQSTNEGTIAAVLVTLVVLVILVAGVGVVVFWLWRTRKFCFKDTQSGDERNSQETLYLKDLNLDPYLLDIVEVLDWKTMKSIARRSGMRNAEIEEHVLNNHDDVKEQKYTLLQAWSQRQGLHAYPALIKTLYEMKQRKTADEIQKIVEKGQAKAQP